MGSDASHDRVRVFKDMSAILSMQQGNIIVANMTDPDWVPAIIIASAVIKNHDCRTCHASIVSHELGLPCIERTKDDT